MADKDFIMDGVASRAIMDEPEIDAKSDEQPKAEKKTAPRPRKSADAKPSS